LRQVQDWTEITTPYLDRHNDYLQIYVRRTSTGFKLTDDAYILTDLEQSGFNFDTPKRQELLKVTLNGLGVQREGDALVVNCTAENFPVRKHCLLQAMLTVNDLFFLSSPTSVAGLFYEDVVSWLDANDIRYTPNVKFTGKTGYDHMFDFVIPKSRREPERILKTLTRPSRESAQAAVLAWIDTRDVRPADAQAFALLNDAERVPPAVVDALSSYDVRPVLWSRREDVRDLLVA
jgi:Domain of unknown function DUF1829/Domain of unknown function DUF1828